MTRINVVPVTELCDEHLRAEYREITRIPNHLKKVGFKPNLDKQPNHYTLGTGHVKFFYDKMGFLEARFNELSVEMRNRGFKADKTVSWVDFPDSLCKNYVVRGEDLEINRQRIKDRWPKNAHWYRKKVEFVK